MVSCTFRAQRYKCHDINYHINTIAWKQYSYALVSAEIFVGGWGVGGYKLKKGKPILIEKVPHMEKRVFHKEKK